MAAYFFDSSALVKRYAKEVGTSWVFSLVRRSAGNHLYIARITGVELVSALTRRERAHRLSASAVSKAIARFEREFQNRYTTIEMTARLVAAAMKLARSHALRGYDAVQLASAIEVHHARVAACASPLTIISADDPLNAAALAEGLLVENPHNHP